MGLTGDEEVTEALARILHDIAVGCEPHYPYRTGMSQQEVHRIQAGWLVAAIKREMRGRKAELSRLLEP